MQNRIEESSNFESEIRSKPIKSLEATKEKMHDPARVKCKCVLLTEMFARTTVETRQENDENSIDCTKRFKQTRDILKQTVGEETLELFAEQTQEHKD